MFPLSGKADQLQQFLTRCRIAAFGLFAILQAIGNVAGHREVLEQRVGLKHDAEIALRRRQRGNIAAILFHRAVSLDVQPGNGPQQGWSCRSRRDPETDELTLVNIDTDIVQRGEIAKALG